MIASVGAYHSPATLVPGGEHTPQRFQETVKHTQEKQETSVGNQGPILVGTTHTRRLGSSHIIYRLSETSWEGAALGRRQETSSPLSQACCLQRRGQRGPQAAFLKGRVVPES